MATYLKNYVFLAKQKSWQFCLQQERVHKGRRKRKKKKPIGFLGDKKGARNNIMLDLKNGNDNLKQKNINAIQK